MQHSKFSIPLMILSTPAGVLCDCSTMIGLSVQNGKKKKEKKRAFLVALRYLSTIHYLDHALGHCRILLLLQLLLLVCHTTYMLAGQNTTTVELPLGTGSLLRRHTLYQSG